MDCRLLANAIMFALLATIFVDSASAVSGSGVSFSGAKLGVSAGGAGSSCTDGIDCPCDTIPAANPTVFGCEDWEAISLYEDPTNGAGTDISNAGAENVHGPWYSHIGDSVSPGRRGWNSYWAQVYEGGGGAIWGIGDPVTPHLGITCASSGSGCRQLEYCSEAQGNLLSPALGEDCWGGAGQSFINDACVDIQRIENADYAAREASVTGPAVNLIGRQHYAQPTPIAESCGIHGRWSFGASYQQIGVTFALSYDSTTPTSLITDHPIKANQWGRDNSDYFPMGFTNGCDTITPNGPYCPAFTWCRDVYNTPASGGGAQSSGIADGFCDRDGISSGTCDVSGITMLVGTKSCYNNRIRFEPALTGDFTYDEWHCAQGYINQMGSSTGEVIVWHDGEKIIHATNVPLDEVESSSGYSYLSWNTFSNANQVGSGGQTCQQGNRCTTQHVNRHFDNWVYNEGPPVGCDDIGFGFEGGVP